MLFVHQHNVTATQFLKTSCYYCWGIIFVSLDYFKLNNLFLHLKKEVLHLNNASYKSLLFQQPYLQTCGLNHLKSKRIHICDYCRRNASQRAECYFTVGGYQCLIVSFSHFTTQIPLKIGEYFFHTTKNLNQTCAIFLQFVLWCYQVIIMICKHGAVSCSQLYAQ